MVKAKYKTFPAKFVSVVTSLALIFSGPTTIATGSNAAPKSDLSQTKNVLDFVSTHGPQYEPGVILVKFKPPVAGLVVAGASTSFVGATGDVKQLALTV